MPRYPNVFVQVSDGKPISEIIERAETAMKRAGISSAERREFRACVPRQYARLRSITFGNFARRIRVRSPPRTRTGARGSQAATAFAGYVGNCELREIGATGRTPRG